MRGLEVQLWALYGDDRDPVVSRQVLTDVLANSSSQVPVVIGGDYNSAPAEVAEWISDHPELEVVSAGRQRHGDRLLRG